MSSAQGRFTSPDQPFADQHLDNPQSWNLYSYVRNNPLALVDEDGNCATLKGNPCRGRVETNPATGILYAGMAMGTGGAAAAAGAGYWGVASSLRGLYYAASAYLLGHPEQAQEAAVAAVEQFSGAQAPNAASTFGFTKVEGTIEGFTYGRLANGAEVAAQFTKSGNSLTASVLGAFNPQGTKVAGTLSAIVQGAQAVAKSEGATSLTLQAVGVINTKLASLLVKQGFKETTIKVGKEVVKAYEKTLEIE